MRMFSLERTSNMHDLRVAAVLVSWRRAGNIGRIIESLSRIPQIKKVVIWNNSPAMSYDSVILGDTLKHAPAHWPPITVDGDGKNHGLWGRYLAAINSDGYDCVFTQDDDYQVQNVPEILASWQANPDRVTACLYPWHLQRDHFKRWRNSCGEVIAHEVLLGWGSAFDWRLIKGAMDPYISKFGKSQEFLRESDRIFTIGMKREAVVMPHKTLALDGEQTGGVALYTQPDHMASIVKARTNALQLLGIHYEHMGL